jgi:hypothetical protein
VNFCIDKEKGKKIEGIDAFLFEIVGIDKIKNKI